MFELNKELMTQVQGGYIEGTLTGSIIGAVVGVYFITPTFAIRGMFRPFGISDCFEMATFTLTTTILCGAAGFAIDSVRST